jgi:hypothetical protein
MKLIGDKKALFSSRRPVNAVSGVSSGLKSVAKGVLGGCVTIISAPIIGAKTDGVRGFFGGLLGGVLGGAALAVTGAGVGNFFIPLSNIRSGLDWKRNL